MMLYIFAPRSVDCFRVAFPVSEGGQQLPVKYAAWGVLALECGNCFGLFGLIALIIVPRKTGWLMDMTSADERCTFQI